MSPSLTHIHTHTHTHTHRHFWLVFSLFFFVCLFLTISLIYLYIVPKRFGLLALRGRGREGEREGEKHQCMTDTGCFPQVPPPRWGPWPATQACCTVELGIEPATIRFPGRLSVYRRSPASQASLRWPLYRWYQQLSGRIHSSALLGSLPGPTLETDVRWTNPRKGHSDHPYHFFSTLICRDRGEGRERDLLTSGSSREHRGWQPVPSPHPPSPSHPDLMRQTVSRGWR